MQLWYWISLAAVSLSALVSGYHVALGMVAAVPRRRPRRSAAEHSRFAILIPAHNEETSISASVASCLSQDYPAEKYFVLVIADNCTDRTAELARAAGAECLERFDRARSGKGAALAWGIPQALAKPCDAVLIVDADCALDAGALRALDRHVAAGHQAVQLNNVPSNADDCPTSYLLAVANKLENDFFYAPKDRLGLAVLLRGTGMMLARQLLQECPWEAQSLTEDSEYSMRLFRRGQRIRFEPSAAVRSAAPVSRDQLTAQRTRWISGQRDVATSHAWSLVRDAVSRLDLRLLDAAWTNFVLTRALVLAIVVGAVATTAVAALLTDDVRIRGLSVVSLLSLGGFAAYVAAGVVAFGLSKQRMRLLALAVPLVFSYCTLTLRASLQRNGAWSRMQR
ncbi:MAG: hypothetical protein DCC67_16815 [Planctomycetota bacterium]|nr:MAG: hypothetical protein DCC67_16815 [Planctomycetota bacterium]